ncbi:MAG: signal peptide peptidase SppA [Alphaproteobacteria bacterium]|jgi:protease-4|uniref:signal peptide peptidase SppA n=1 Tax=Devosia sp. XGJD_8 TaxID=3391187 RepID=UPI001D89D4C0|nr:signal peptide peptidase SppA [Alphaproteobacteria bacterium]MBU1562287.1 signal peptide peptidase SppA [Alphaproteobacteria bacterium]MBU2302741.1 signal peptide peptidase SppA [Alphaproteobacteria bacterium]MBU2369310.1 signal peptide peptidase SppA [Alphaproteobacteria bacterium]
MIDEPVSQPQRDPHGVIAAETYRRSRGLWRVLAFIALAIAIIVGLGRFAMPQGAAGDYVARLVIDGTIATDPGRLRTIEALAEDGAVKAVIIAINSPGGTTAGGEELYEALGQLRASKPTVAVIKELGASAAYMTAIATDHIFARRLSIVGSIGVLYQHVNAGKLLETIGVDLDKVASGPLKAEPDFDEPMEGAPRASIAALVDDSFQWFVDVVAERRGLTRGATLALADGRIVTGRVGMEAGLIDAIGGEAEAIAWLEAERDVPVDLEVKTVWPEPEQGFDLIGTFLNGQARSALGLPDGPITLDGLVSLWQVGSRS